MLHRHAVAYESYVSSSLSMDWLLGSSSSTIASSYCCSGEQVQVSWRNRQAAMIVLID